MTDLLPPLPQFSVFLAASLVLAVTPGPGVFYIVTRSLAQGRRSGLASVAGVALGNLGNAVAASVGVAALFAVSPMAFSIVKYGGAAYLLYLGAQALRPSENEATSSELQRVGVRRLFLDGIFVALLNPKTTLFFAAFLPQFVSAGTTPAFQSTALGVFFVGIAAVTDSLYAMAAGTMATSLGQTLGRWRFGRYLSASVFFGLAALTMLGGG
ncbi:MAG: LysE family translocator [Methylococcus sp.]|nr:LysE family translocator [Methylococcus sp.]